MTYSFLKLAEDVLKVASHPLTYKEIWEQAKQDGLDLKVGSKGATPWISLSAYLSTQILHNPNSKFIRVGTRPQRYFLRSREQEISPKYLGVVQSEDMPADKTPTSYLEQDLHPLLAYFVANSPNFSGGKMIYMKTVDHHKSIGSDKLTKWLHPDMVGVYFPFVDFKKEVIKLGKSLGWDSIQVFSFELKRTINSNNYREYFFQAVSNSSWAHEGYLVAAEISDDDEFRRELGRLTNAFGIGIIHLNIKDIHSSSILFDATSRNQIDWDTVDKLCKVNKDFDSFIERLNIDIDTNHIHKSEYDKIIEEPVKHIQEKLKVETVE